MTTNMIWSKQKVYSQYIHDIQLADLKLIEYVKAMVCNQCEHWLQTIASIGQAFYCFQHSQKISGLQPNADK